MLSSRLAIRVNTPGVGSETIDREAIIINFDSGLYYSTNPCGGLIWAWIETGATADTIVAALAQVCDASRTEITVAVQTFLDTLLLEKLIVLGDASAAPPAPSVLPTGRLAFEPPAITRYADMAEMLLLDPVHEIEDRSQRRG
ncbi:MAG: PqqD family protein [bacterium]